MRTGKGMFHNMLILAYQKVGTSNSPIHLRHAQLPGLVLDSRDVGRISPAGHRNADARSREKILFIDTSADSASTKPILNLVDPLL